MQFIEQANTTQQLNLRLNFRYRNDISGYKHWHLQRRKLQEQFSP